MPPAVVVAAPAPIYVDQSQGTPGFPSPTGGLMTIQGQAGMYPILVDTSGATGPVSVTGPIQVTQPTGTNLNIQGRVNLNPDLTIIHNNATITTSGSVIVQNIGRKEITFGVATNGAVTGGTPALTYTIAEIDPVNLTTLMTFPGQSQTVGPFGATGQTDYIQLISYTGAVKISWTVTGSFASVDAWITVKEQTFAYGLTFNDITQPLSVINIDTNDNTIVVGSGTPGVATGGVLSVQGVTGGIPLNGRVNLNPDLTIIHNNATITTSGSIAIPNIGRKEVSFGITISGVVSGGTPSITYVLEEVDPVNLTTQMTLPGNSITLGPYTSSGHTNYLQMISYTGAVRVVWTVTGTTPSFAGVDVWIVVKEQSNTFGLTYSGNSDPLSVINTDPNDNTIVVGAVAVGATGVQNPVLTAGLNSSGVVEAIGSVVDRSAMTAGVQTGNPIIGQSSGVGRIFLSDRLGHHLPGYQTLLAIDVVEGTTINSWLWAQSTTTMTITQATGLLTLNAGAITTTTTDAILTTNKQFPLFNQAPIGCSFKALIVQGTNSFNEIGFGAPTGTTAIISNGAFFRISTSGTIFAVISNNGTETVSASLGTIVSTSYYVFYVVIGDNNARFIMETSTGIPLVDYTAVLPLATPNVAAAVSHIPAFARVYTSGTASVAPQTKIASFQAWQYGINTNQPLSEQLSGAGRNGVLSPTGYVQTTSSMTAAPATITPSNTVAGYNNLGGDYAVALTTSSENPLSVFGFQIPSPYSFYLRSITFSIPVVTTAISVSSIPWLEWIAVVNNTNGSISTGGGQRFPLCINHFYTSATQAAGVTLNLGGSTTAGAGTAAGPVSWSPDTPILCTPGTYLHIAYKVFTAGTITTAGVTRGSVYVDGYYV